jgi:hypothetical protein
MPRRITVDDPDGQPFTIEAQYEGPCPDECGYMIEVGDLISPTDDDQWVLAEHPEE